ncbi:MAG: MinD/ParA family protein [Nitrospirae bacterium]|nr:MAG: MinD/ParA family protein [Nitrospirota bacterium]
MPTILSIASGKGGAGKSMVASNLALLLARRGHQVTLVDLDTGGANLHILFGLLHPPATLTDFLDRRCPTIQAVAQPIPLCTSLSLIPGTGETLASANLQHAKKKRLIQHLRKLAADVIVVDVGAGTHYHTLDFFLSADLYLTVATPDPTSVLDLYRFIKLAAIRKVLSAFLARDPVSEALTTKDFHSVEEVLEAVGATYETGRHRAEATLATFKPFMILNRMGKGSKVNTLHLQQMVKHYIGAELQILGQIPDDEAVEQSIHHYLPVVEYAPQAQASLSLQHIVANIERELAMFCRSS